ncbi:MULTISPECIES: phosphopantetheine-binding protein [unclassified Streptomyces]|jgi:act minimal PKS acyl carrier protein|uniref:phosphopantetheine-binding protein n=1 Tax=unclassified Streptomyces TaxID=2593676 RepID=UPI000C6FD311|nr:MULTISPECIES: phosphopantetheine-binding protein [unclassified Streptomyces]AUH39568.1 actinorhodin polyketide synthase [Streptomyces sp. CMB-StM0423]AZM49774.1 actinorhodin polyketide synthase [Streptomyces sp. WAC 06738]
MTDKPFTLDDLKRVLLQAAGADESTDLDGDILDATFEVLGYESLALLETAGQIEREYGISLDDDALADDLTPRTLIDLVNGHLAAARATTA